jgi:ribonuclease BN (tRNA processing enzyme)
MRLGIAGCRGTRNTCSGRLLTGENVDNREFGGYSSSSLVEATGSGDLVSIDFGEAFPASVNGYLIKNKGFASPGSKNPGGRIVSLVTHYHLDHFTGIGTSSIVYDPRNEVVIVGPSLREGDAVVTGEHCSMPGAHQGVIHALKSLLSCCDYEDGGSRAYENFPVKVENMRALKYVDFDPGRESPRVLNSLGLESLKVEALLHKHPVYGAVGYRISELHDGQWSTLVHLSDIEHDGGSGDAAAVDFVATAKGKVVVYRDAQYTRLPGHHDSYQGKQGWGHSTREEGVDFLLAVLDRLRREDSGSEIKRLLLGHHDPGSNDSYLKLAERETKRHARAKGVDPDLVELARGGSWYDF